MSDANGSIVQERNLQIFNAVGQRVGIFSRLNGCAQVDEARNMIVPTQFGTRLSSEHTEFTATQVEAVGHGAFGST